MVRVGVGVRVSVRLRVLRVLRVLVRVVGALLPQPLELDRRLARLVRVRVGARVRVRVRVRVLTRVRVRVRTGDVMCALPSVGS